MPQSRRIAGVIGSSASVATLPNGRHVATVPIKAGEQEVEGQALYEEIFGGPWPTNGLDRYESAAIVGAVREAGIVGMGGAAFPTHVKLAARPDKPIHTLLVNGCECEPYLTADYRIIPPLMAACVVSTLLTTRLKRDSIYTLKLHRRGIDLRKEGEPDVLRSLYVRDIVDPDPEVIPASTKFLPVLDLAVDAFGPARMMWGSDFPPVSRREGYANALRWPREHLGARLSKPQLAQMFGGVAERIYWSSR